MALQVSSFARTYGLPGPGDFDPPEPTRAERIVQDQADAAVRTASKVMETIYDMDSEADIRQHYDMLTAVILLQDELLAACCKAGKSGPELAGFFKMAKQLRADVRQTIVEDLEVAA